jgi:deoxyribodipyrimidine photo-lyase
MNIVLHRRDLRTEDNKAVDVAGEDAAPVYVFDPDIWGHPLSSDSRQEFVLDSLKDLNRQYITLGTELSFFHGDVVEVASNLGSNGHKVVFNKDSNHFHQDKERELRRKFKGVSGNTVETSKGRSNDWDKKAEKWFKSDTYRRPESISGNNLSGNTTVDEIRQEYEVEAEKDSIPSGGTHEAEKKLEEFAENIENYAGSISSPYKAEQSTSHLSPYIKYGCISPRQVYQRIGSVKTGEAGVEMFKDRLFWQQHFNQKIEDNTDLFKEAINPVYRDLWKDNHDQEKINSWKRGETGFPLVDASMRALVKTGWLNFRMRAMCASFLSYILKQWWKIGADHYYRHLIDADVAINYYQWQMQSGLIGVHANRIYNPTKQAKENDPKGKFIRKYVPELRPLPDRYIHTPWKIPAQTQEKLGINIGKEYPEPVVNYEREAKKARQYFRRKSSEAYSAFEDDKVWKKASLSSKHSRKEIISKGKNRQKGLEDFQE